MAANSHNNSHPLKRDDPRRADHLKPYGWIKGQSGNREGRRAELRMTAALRAMSTMPLPAVVRKRLEAGIGGTLPDDLTFADGYGIAQWLSLFGINVGFSLAIGIDTRHATDGTETHKVEIIDSSTELDGSLEDRVYAHMFVSAYKRGKLYNMPMPELERIAAEHGFQLPDAEEAKQLPVVSSTEAKE